MSLIFEVHDVFTLQRPHKVIVEGRLVEGVVHTDSAATVVKPTGGLSFPVMVKGPVLGLPRPKDTSMMSLTLIVPLEHRGMVLPGDVIKGADTP